MNLSRLYEILAATTVQLRKGKEVEVEELSSMDVVHVYLMPDETEAPKDMVKVDVEFIIIGVDMAAAEAHRSEFVEILDQYPEPERLAGGPSYIEVGAAIGDQGAAFQMFALGQALGLWKVITPATLGFKGDDAARMAGMGYVMMSGYKAAA